MIGIYLNKKYEWNELTVEDLIKNKNVYEVVYRNEKYGNLEDEYFTNKKEATKQFNFLKKYHKGVKFFKLNPYMKNELLVNMVITPAIEKMKEAL